MIACQNGAWADFSADCSTLDITVEHNSMEQGQNSLEGAVLPPVLSDIVDTFDVYRIMMR